MRHEFSSRFSHDALAEQDHPLPLSKPSTASVRLRPTWFIHNPLGLYAIPVVSSKLWTPLPSFEIGDLKKLTKSAKDGVTMLQAPGTLGAMEFLRITAWFRFTACYPQTDSRVFGHYGFGADAIHGSCGGKRKKLLFDCGRGTVIRLSEVGVPLTAIDALFTYIFSLLQFFALYEEWRC
jgi:hypothetical protein